MDAATSFVGLIGPAIERGDSTVLKRIVPYADQYLLQGDCTRGVLSQTLRDAYPNSELAEACAELIAKA
jgi:hypothetical protein